jgi:hypothetical protein
MSVFSMEWIIMQNYENAKTSYFDDKNFKNKVNDNKIFLNNLYFLIFKNCSLKGLLTHSFQKKLI